MGGTGATGVGATGVTTAPPVRIAFTLLTCAALPLTAPEPPRAACKDCNCGTDMIFKRFDNVVFSADVRACPIPNLAIT